MKHHETTISRIIPYPCTSRTNDAYKRLCGTTKWSPCGARGNLWHRHDGADGNARVLGEVTELRDEAQKHFRMADGSYIAVDYGLPVHYTEDDGESWEEIDNTLTLTDEPTRAGNDSQRALDADTETARTEASYIAQNGESTRSFAQSLRSGFLFSAGTDEHRVSMSLASPAAASRATADSSAAGAEAQADNAAQAVASTDTRMPEPFNQAAVAEISYPNAPGTEADAKAQPAGTRSDEPEDEPSIADQVQPTKLYADVLYRDVYDDVDLIYTLYSYNVKENIIINAAREDYSFFFDLSLDGLAPVLQDDGSITLEDEDGEAAYLIPAPYMYDNAGNTSDAVSYTLTQAETDTWTLTVKANDDWINDNERAFPVVIDPTVIDKERWSDDSAFGVTYVIAGSPYASQQDYQEVYFGYNEGSTSHEHRVYIGFDNLPIVPTGSEVVNAQFYMGQNYYTNIGMSSFSGELHEVPSSSENISLKGSYSTNKAWITSRSWSNKPTHNATVLDYTMIGLSTQGKFVNWDMTGLVKQWYASNPNIKAVALIMTNASSCSNTHYGMAGFLGYANNSGPMFVVNYRDLTGIEPYYTYQALGADRAGSAYISDYTGNLTTVTPLVSYASGINPFSLNLVYNSCYFADTGVDNATPAADLGFGMYMGSGMKLDMLQKVEYVNLKYEVGTEQTKTYVKYTDGDGTAHYFAKKGPNDTGYTENDPYYYDEDGLGLKITEYDTDYFRMEDDKGNKLVFANGFLLWKEDANGNKIQLFYEHSNGTHTSNWYPVSGDRLKYIKQINSGASATTVATFSYTSFNYIPNYLSTITDAAGNEYSFEYSCYKLLSIKRNNEDFVEFTHPYDTAQNRYVNPVSDLKDSKSGYSLHFDYTGRRVSSYCEYGGSTQGAGATITRVPGEKTKYVDWGNDRISGNEDDITTTYLFDYAARTVNAYTTDYSGAIIGASNAVHTGTGNTDKKNNRTLRSAGIGMAAMSLVRNGGFELTDSSVAWTSDIPSGSTCNALVKTGEKTHTGNSAFKTWVNSSATGVTGCHTPAEQLTAGVTYTASVYVNTSSATSFGSEGIYIKVKDSWGSYKWSERLKYKTDSTIDDGWVKLSFSFQPSHSGNQTVYICNEGVQGAVYYDDFQLEKASGPSNVNLIENGGFGSSYYGWKTESDANVTSSSVANITAIQGSVALKITGSPTAEKNIYQTVTVNQPGTQTYVLSGWAKANAVPDNVTTATGDTDEEKEANDHDKQFGLRTIVTYSDNTTENHYVKFNADVTDWQFASLTIVPKQPTKTVSSIKVVCAYEKNANTAYFDNLSLVKEVAQTMRYDDDGNLVSVQSTGNSEESSSYSNGNLTQVVTGGEGTYDYTYDTKHNLTSAKNAVVKESYDVDDYGNTTSSSLTHYSGSGSPIRSSTTYTNNGNLVSTRTNARGLVTTNSYSGSTSLMFGTPTSVTDPTGTTVVSVYRNDGLVTSSYIASKVSLVRTYNSKNQLTQIDRGAYLPDGTTKLQQQYNFEYDVFGNTTKNKVGTQSLGTYTYDARNGLLNRMTYGNGAYVGYAYDTLGRKTHTTTSSGDSYTYNYTGDGQLYQMTDNAGTSATSDDLIYGYNYDTLGRLIGSTMSTGSTVNLQTTHKYDENNRLTNQSWKVLDKTYREQYNYDESGRLTWKKITLPDNVLRTLTQNYDTLSRVSSTGSPAATTIYNYKDADYYTGTPGTTGLVSAMSVTSTHTGSSAFERLYYKYAYDGVGNIAHIEQMNPNNTRKRITYYDYDAQSQLIMESDSIDGTWTYGYDQAGNLRSKEHVQNQQTVEEYTYSYSNTTWRDKLTALSVTRNGTTTNGSYTYDASGNPTSYFNPKDLATWSMTWRNGRELATARKTGTSVSYEYDVNSLRTKKTVGGVVHNYYYAGGQLLRESYTENGNSYVLDFVYDQNGRPFMLCLKQNNDSVAYYYYILNLQGDVIYLADYAGTAVATYDYDAWGNIRSQSGWLANRNPLRYRGYYYDNESGWYYLQSRYYDPTLGRFINADEVSFLGTNNGFLGYNLFSYCRNSPVNRYDGQGTWDWNVALGIAAAVVAVGLTVATLGVAAPAAACALTTAITVTTGLAGTAVTTAAAVTVATTFAVTTTYVADFAYSSVTGDSPLLDDVFHGDVDAYSFVGSMAFAATGMLLDMASMVPACFTEGTIICADCGGKPIEEIRPGDYVWAWDEETGDVALKKVVETYVNETAELTHIVVRGEEIVSTPNHPFYSPVKGWTSACKLRAGDILVLVNGEYVVVEKIQHELLESPIEVYNFQVEDYHTYFVGHGVLVHNKCDYNKGDTTGYGEAPKKGDPGSTYTQISSDGKNQIVSQTTYNNYRVPGQRIDFIGRSHDGIPTPHVHSFSYILIKGVAYRNGNVVTPY